MDHSPKWLRFLEKKFHWLEIPNLAVILVTLQALGFLMVLSNPVWLGRLALVPSLVVEGEYWRLITFLALPLSLDPIWSIFSLWFLYFIVDAIEAHWGAFRTTFYVLISILLMIAVSFALDFPITNISVFDSSLFLAAAALYPEMEVRLFFVIPVKMKWLGWLTGAYVGYELLGADWAGRFYLMAVYFNFALFFGPAFAARVRQAIRRWKFKNQFRN